MVGLDPACPEPESELQMRAAVLLALTWDIKTQSGIRQACSSFNAVMLLHLHCGICHKACHLMLSPSYCLACDTGRSGSANGLE